MIRRYGRPLPSPKTVATEPDERGPVAEELLPGKYNINPLAYDIQRFPAIEIPAGHVGVVTLLSGADPVEKNTWTVAPGEKGVQHDTLPPGLIFYNPYLKNVEIVDIRSQKYDMREEDAIQFPSKDSFTITMEGTIEWGIRSRKWPWAMAIRTTSSTRSSCPTPAASLAFRARSCRLGSSSAARPVANFRIAS
jgi:hypothetical protein